MTDSLHKLADGERAAAIAIASRVGATARAHDIDGRQGAVDVELVYPDGSVAALEVSSCAGQGVRQRDSLLAADGNEWPAPGAATWDIRVGSPETIPELRVRYGRIIRALEQHGMTSVDLPHRSASPSELADLEWLESTDVTFSRMSTRSGREPVVYVLPHGASGMVDDQLVGLGDAVVMLLQQPNQLRHIEKLRRSGCRETHLFLVLHEGALPFAQMSALMGRVKNLPECSAPPLPGGLTHLWFVSVYSHVLVETSGRTWRFHDLMDETER